MTPEVRIKKCLGLLMPCLERARWAGELAAYLGGNGFLWPWAKCCVPSWGEAIVLLVLGTICIMLTGAKSWTRLFSPSKQNAAAGSQNRCRKFYEQDIN